MKAAAMLLPIMALAGCEAAPEAAAQIAFADAAITLPADPAQLPPGPGRQAVADNCLACHSPSTMLLQPPLLRAKWESNVTKMIEVYKAPIDPAATPAIVDYFVAVQAEQQAAPAR